MEKILTIIIPTYNMEKYLDKCLTSLIIEDKKLMKLLEVLVVIDGAKDRSSEIGHTYQDKYPETFRVIDKENGNYGSCINRGLKEAKGKYVKVLDADDSFDNGNFSKYLKTLITMPDVDVVFSRYRTVYEEGNVGNEFSRPFDAHTKLKWDNVIGSLTNKSTHTAMHELAFRRTMLVDMHYIQTESISYTDQEWVFYPFLNANSFYYIDLVIYNYLVGRAGQTMDFSVIVKGVPAHLSIGNRMLECFKNIPQGTESYQYMYATILWFLTHVYSLCLTCKEEGIHLSELAILDTYLRNTNKSLYKSLDDNTICVMKVLRVHYIRWWRNGKNAEKLPLKNRLLVRYLTRNR